MPAQLVPMPPELLVELVNGWGSVPRQEAGEEGLPYPAPTLLSGRTGVASDAEPSSDTALVRVADAVHPVFATHDREERVRLVHALLRRTEVRPSLAVRQGRVAALWVVPAASDALLAGAALALRAHLAEHADDRLGTCAGRRCADVYVDASPTGRRRFCSVTCQNRARVAEFRRRRGSAG